MNQLVQKRIAEKNRKNLQLLNPKLTLLDGYATFCAAARSKLITTDVAFCANLTPKWQAESGALLATNLSLLSLEAPGYSPAETELFRAFLNKAVLPGIEGIELYRAENQIGKQIKDVKVLPGKIDLDF
ncbi:hypothetical protein [Propionivibrio limicola]|uniref:hypothetical protein n=1 Tax=Propionivibrio limicola TaxID=167645 RepID=UPI001290FCCE|nr:hypothetical protein [Propionivibrio limicola]